MKPFKNGNCLSVPEIPKSISQTSTNSRAWKQPDQGRREFFHFRRQKLDSTISRWRSLDFLVRFLSRKNERAKGEDSVLGHRWRSCTPINFVRANYATRGRSSPLFTGGEGGRTKAKTVAQRRIAVGRHARRGVTLGFFGVKST